MGNLNGDSTTYLGVSINIPAKKFFELKKLNIPIIFYDYEEEYYDEEGNLCKRYWGYQKKEEDDII